MNRKQALKIMGLITIAFVFVVLLVIGIVQVRQSGDRLRHLQDQPAATEQPQPDGRPAPQPPPPVVQPVNPNVRPPSALPGEPHEIPDDPDWPGMEDLDDYGDWLPPFERSVPSPLPVYRNESIVIPNNEE
jgi:hypothetical protein